MLLPRLLSIVYFVDDHLNAALAKTSFAAVITFSPFSFVLHCPCCSRIHCGRAFDVFSVIADDAYPSPNSRRPQCRTHVQLIVLRSDHCFGSRVLFGHEYHLVNSDPIIGQRQVSRVLFQKVVIPPRTMRP